MIAALPLVTSTLSSLLGPSQPTGATPGVASTHAGSSFSSILSSFSSDTVSKLKASESASISGLQGTATTQSVVEAMMQAQESLQTALAVRDKTVAAFQDVTRMSI